MESESPWRARVSSLARHTSRLAFTCASFEVKRNVGEILSTVVAIELQWLSDSHVSWQSMSGGEIGSVSPHEWNVATNEIVSSCTG